MGAVLRRETSGSAWWHLLLFFFSLRVRFSRNTRLTVSCRASTSQIIQPWSLAARDGEWRASKHKRKMWARYGSRTRGVNPPNPPPKPRSRFWVQSAQELINISPPPPPKKQASISWLVMLLDPSMHGVVNQMPTPSASTATSAESASFSQGRDGKHLHVYG